ncbi:MAG: rhomboid family intramembrane serine protease [Chloroflexi bacterium]|nr:rhomboid family intramembrane serine protease [Chloroflexota bacterium]
MFPIRDLNPTHSRTLLTLLLIVVNAGVFFFWQPFGAGPEEEIQFLYRQASVSCELAERRPLTAIDLATGQCQPVALGAAVYPEKNVWLAVLTSMFLHGSILHLAGNMWFLWIFGDNVEDRFGHLPFLTIYLLAGIAGTVGFVWMRPDEVAPLIGASGSVAGVLGAYLVLFPFRPVLAFAGFFLLPVPALIFIGLWLVGQFLVLDPTVAWEAHVFGFAAGVVLSLLFAPWVRRGHPSVR